LLTQLIVLPRQGETGLQQALAAQIKAAILSGRLATGVRLPATRVLAGAIGVSRNTVLAAYNSLTSEGYLAARGSAGTCVSAVLNEAGRRPAHARATHLADERLQPYWRATKAQYDGMAEPRIDLRLGRPEQRAFPFDIWNRIAMRTVRKAGLRDDTYASSPQGHAPLREMLVQHVSRTRAVACTVDDIQVTAGAQQAFDLIARLLVAPGKTVVAVEDPGYSPIRDAFAAHGAQLVGVPVDADGLMVERIPKDARIVCVTPSHQFPLGVVMSAARRTQLLQWAASVGGTIVEDDYDSEFRFGERSLDALKTLDRGDAVFYVGTFSKSLFPALRLGFVVPPAWARAAMARAKQLGDWQSPLHLQATLAAFMYEGHLRSHVRKMHRLYQARREAVLSEAVAGARLVPYASCAGLHVTLQLPSGTNDQEIAATLAAQGIAVEPVSKYRFAAPTHPAIALGFGLADELAIRQAITALRKVV